MKNQLPWRPVLTVVCAAAIAAPASAQESKTGGAAFNFVGADIDAVIKAVGLYTDIAFLTDPRVKGTITMTSDKPLSKAQAFQLLASMLRLQGYATVAGDGYVKVVPEADAKLQAGPRSDEKLRGDQIATQVFRLSYESAAGMVPVLRPLIAPNNTINADAGSNTLVITDYADNLRRMARLIATLDVPPGIEPEVIPVRHAIASDIATMVNRLLDQNGNASPGAQGAAAGAAGSAAGGTPSTVLADARTNSVVVRAPSTARANLAKSLIAKFDQPTAMPGNIHVVHLKNAEAMKLAQTLRAVIAADASVSAASSSQGQAAMTAPQNSASSALSSASTSSSSGAGLQTPPSSTASAQPTTLASGGPTGFIQADAATNTLILTCNEVMYRNLRAVIDELDARRAQVYIESLIVEVSDTVKAALGVQWAGATGNSGSSYRVGAVTGFSSGGDNLITQAISGINGTGYTAPSNGLNLAIFNSKGLGVLAHALASDSGTNVLSMPNLITLDNEEAKILVGSNVPFVTGSYTTSSSTSSNPFQTVERKDIGVALRVRPQISEGGTVKMAIYQETSAITDTTNAAGIITSKRSIDTKVLVDDGQLIVLGGLIGDDGENSVEQVPVLGSLPVIGGLFKYRNKSRAKTNLLVFLRPIIIRNNEQSLNLSEERYDYMRRQSQGAVPNHSAILPDLGAPQLPQLEKDKPVGRIE